MSPLIFCFLFTFLLPIEGQDGAYFLHRGTVYTSYSSWVISYSFDLQHYESHLSKLQDNVNEYLSIISNPQNEFGKIGELVAERLRRELEQFGIEYDRISLFFQNIKLALTEKKRRTPRALIPAVGGLLSQLFGVATQKSMHAVKEYIAGLSDAQNSLSHIVEQSLTIVNRTINHVKRNEVTLNKLINVTNNMKMDINHLSSKIKELEPQVLYNRLMSLVHDTVHAITTSLREIYFDLSQLNLFTSQLIDGQLPVMLVPPEELYKTLKDIEDQLPRTLMLPYPLSNMKNYYKSLQTVLIPGNNFELHIVTAVPLIRQDSMYELFEAVTVPVPCENQSQSLTYSLESDYIALSADRQSYMVPDSAFARLCIGTHLTFCNLRYPILNVNTYNTCVYSLITRSIFKVTKFCKWNSIPESTMPVIKYLMEGKWLISTRKRLNYDIICNEFGVNTKYVTSQKIGPGISLLELKLGCSISSKLFYIPPRFRKEESLRSLVLFDHELSQHLSFPDILQLNLSVMSSESVTVDEMTTISVINDENEISKLQLRLDNLMKDKTKLFNLTDNNFVIGTLLVITLIFVLIVFVFLCAYVIKRRFKAYSENSSKSSGECHLSPPEHDYLHPLNAASGPLPGIGSKRPGNRRAVSFGRRDGVIVV